MSSGHGHQLTEWTYGMGFVVGSGPGAPKVLIFDVLRSGDGLPHCFLGLPRINTSILFKARMLAVR